MSLSDVDTGTMPLVDKPDGNKAPKRSFYISLLVPGEETRFFDLHQGSQLSIGRSHECDIVISSNSVSRKHAVLTMKGPQVNLEDLGSRNGTWKNGKRLMVPTVIKPGDETGVGTAMLAVHEVLPWSTRHEGLLDHESFIERLHQEFDRNRFTKRTFSVAALVFPREHFTTKNDMAPIYYRLREMLRPMMVVGHYGASILELLLPEQHKNEARELISQIRTRFKKLNYTLQTKVLSFPEDAQGLDQLLGRVVRLAIEKDQSDSVSSEFSINNSTLEGNILLIGNQTLVVSSEKMRSLMETVDKAAQAPISVIINGETGVGKELIADAIHRRGPRENLPLIKINCAALPEHLLESELFGHSKGAFSGAVKDKVGLFEEADEGTVFLDEIGEMPASLQVKLLRVLQEKTFRRVGDVVERSFKARILAATNRDLEDMVSEGNFREDLFYRLNGITLFVPPLRERQEEIAYLADLFLQEAAIQIGRRVDGISAAALKGLESYAWPGNVRELKNVIERAVLISDGPILEAGAFSKNIVQAEQDLETEESSSSIESDIFLVGLWEQVEALEKRLIREGLKSCNENRSETARLLQIPRKTLLAKIKKYELGNETVIDGL